MDIAYPSAPGHDRQEWEHPVPSLPFPFYEGYRAGVPYVPSPMRDADIVHIHSVFALGAAGAVLSRYRDLPLVLTYHTPFAEYTDYVSPSAMIADGLKEVLKRYERFILNRANIITTPSATTRRVLQDKIGTLTDIEVVSNGVDISIFEPVDDTKIRQRHDLSGQLIGYTGRHGVEKELGTIIDIAEELPQDVTVVFGGDGPDRSRLEAVANTSPVDVRFLGFLPRDELPAFYSMLDVFVFPSPVETEGLVAMEAIACGTPVVGVAEGALPETIKQGRTGLTFPYDDIKAAAAQIETITNDIEWFRDQCLDERQQLDVHNTLNSLSELYSSIS